LKVAITYKELKDTMNKLMNPELSMYLKGNIA